MEQVVPLIRFVASRDTSVSQEPLLRIELPSAFTPEHERAVFDYLAGRLVGRAAWSQAFRAFDLLDEAMLVTGHGRQTFRTAYRAVIEAGFVDGFIDELLALEDVAADSPALWARFARQIVQHVADRGWRRPDVPESRLLVSYLLYWWGAFARVYALEVEIFRDLRQSGMQFTAHDLRDRQQRFSLSDLVVQGQAGNIKTSVYFIQVAAPLVHDFYIVRITSGDRVYTLVMMLQPQA
jgi:hypothetical protein